MATDVDGQLQGFFLMGRSITHFQLRLAQFVTGCTHADIEDRLAAINRSVLYVHTVPMKVFCRHYVGGDGRMVVEIDISDRK